MPIYAYTCPQCGNLDDHIRKFSEADIPTACSRCGATVRRVMYPGCGFDISKLMAKPESEL